MRHNEHFKLSDILKDFVNKNSLNKGLDKVNVRDAWHNLMGNAISKQTNLITLKNGTLIVSLNSSVLREELNYGKEKIINLINEELGEPLIKKLILQ